MHRFKPSRIETPPQLAYHPARKCDQEGCGRITKERKPFCPDHVEHHPYVQHLLGQMAKRQQEENRVRRLGGRGVDPKGLNATEILVQLRIRGDRTAERLAFDLQIDLDLVETYLRSMAGRRLISVGRSDRGSLVASLSATPPTVKRDRRRRGQRTGPKGRARASA